MLLLGVKRKKRKERKTNSEVFFLQSVTFFLWQKMNSTMVATSCVLVINKFSSFCKTNYVPREKKGPLRDQNPNVKVPTKETYVLSHHQSLLIFAVFLFTPNFSQFVNMLVFFLSLSFSLSHPKSHYRTSNGIINPFCQQCMHACNKAGCIMGTSLVPKLLNLF